VSKAVFITSINLEVIIPRDNISTFFKEIWRVSIQISLLYLYRLFSLASMYTYDDATGIFSTTLTIDCVTRKNISGHGSA